MRSLHILLTAITIGTSTQLLAQGPVFGVKAGLNYSNLYDDEVDDKNALFGFHGGVFGRTDPEQDLGLQVELLYSTRGAQFVYDGFIIDQEWELRTNYLDLPVMLGVRLGEVIELNVGGYAGYLLNAKVTTSGDLGADQDELDKDNFRSLDYGVLGGISLNAGPVQIGARYNLGLGQLADSDEAEFVLGDAKHSFGQIYVAFGIPGSK